LRRSITIPLFDAAQRSFSRGAVRDIPTPAETHGAQAMAEVCEATSGAGALQQ